MTHKRDPVERSALRHREESTTPDVVEITRRVFAAAARRDLDALTSFFAPKAVWDRSDLGMGVLEGDAAISADLEDWWRNYEEWEIALDEVVDFGQGVVLSISKQVGSLPGASERLRRNNADIWRFADRMVVRWTAYADVDDARAAAERLAEERGWAVPEEPPTPDLVARVRDLFVSASRGDFDAIASFFAPDAVWDNSRHGLEIVEGLAAVRRLIEEWFAAYEGLEFEPEEIVDLGNGVVFAAFSQHARLAGSTAEVRLRQPAVAIRADGLAVRPTMYPESDLDEARATAERLAKNRG